MKLKQNFSNFLVQKNLWLVLTFLVVGVFSRNTLFSQEQPATSPTGISLPQERAASAVKPASQQKTRLPLFGSNFFTESSPYESILSFGSGMFPENYWLGPGDRLGIYLLGKSQQNFDVIVNVEGKIYIPTVGMYFVSGMKLNEFQKFLSREFSKYYDNFSVNVMVIEPKKFPVAVAGDVNRPGKYYLTSVNTVLDAIMIAGGPTDRGSLRNIELYRGEKIFTHVDLYQFLLKGEAPSDLFLQPGDKIVVPLIDAIVAIDGEVKRQARFELKTDSTERLSALIALAGGFTDLAYLDNVEISRLLPSGDREVHFVNYQHIAENDSCEENYLLKNGDKVHVFSILDQTHPKFVHIHGEVKRPGTFPFEENLHVVDLIHKAGNLTRSAYLLECEVAKIDPKKATKFIKLDLQKILANPQCEENVLLEEDDRVFIRKIPEWEVGPVIEVRGEVQFPGTYAITEDTTTLFEVMKKAGGFTDRALIREASLIRRSSKLTIDKEYLRLKQIPRDQLTESEYEYLVMKENTQDIGRIVVDFYKLCIKGDMRENVTLKDGDVINVPETPDVVYVTGRVSRPGGVLYEPGKDIKYYLGKAGGVTWDAKKRSIKVTKVSGEIIDDEDVKRLDPGDIIWVPRRPDRDWWEIFRQTIAVVAQVATVYIVVQQAIRK
ncbi:MAG: hypothetical protein GXO74_06335 [Calditrichaeota bacterium]|nr:hypothetical protein [Calditrichota bacterium]